MTARSAGEPAIVKLRNTEPMLRGRTVPDHDLFKGILSLVRVAVVFLDHAAQYLSDG